MTLLDSHLEQIALSSAAIAELPFPTSKIFTNALLHSHDITALIRDTETHERALFTIAPVNEGTRPSARRGTVHALGRAVDPYRNGGRFMKSHRPGAAVATLLGGELGEQIRKEASKEGKERGEIDVNLLLRGAEKLCGVYPIAGAPDKISSLRSRYDHLNSSIMRYESKVSKQTALLARRSKQRDDNGNYDDDDDDEGENLNETKFYEAEAQEYLHVSEEDVRREDEEIRELERKKLSLEDRVSGMEQDLGGLLK